MIRIFIFFIFLFLFSGAVPVDNKPNTMMMQDPILTFGLLSDVHYCDCDKMGDRHYRESLDKLKLAIDDLNQEDLDSVINLGDLIESDFDSYSKVLPVLDQSTARV